MSESSQERGVTPRELKYRAKLETRFGMLRPEDQPLVEIDRAIPLERLIVVPELSSRRISVSSEPNDWKTEELLDVLVKNRFAVVLGDPGSGKSMLVRWLISRFASSAPNAYTKTLGKLIPIPVILREMDLRALEVEQIGRWETFLRAIALQSFMHELVEPAHLKEWLESGALLVIDGFDEVASLELRRRIADALLEFQFYQRHSSSRYLLTSRIVGYDREPIVTLQAAPGTNNGYDPATLDEEGPNRVVQETPLLSAERTIQLSEDTLVIVQVDRTERFVMAPLSDEKIREFVFSWIKVRETDPRTVTEWAGTFTRQLFSRPVLRELSRNPQTLGLACYVQRIDGSLPEGRAKLFERVVSAFLNRIPDLRRQPFPFPREDARRWLSRIAFEMQKRRTDAEKSKRRGHRSQKGNTRGVAVSSRQAGAWVRSEGIRLHGKSPDVKGFLKAVGEASGIFLEREPDRFEFLHLSFQEYLAALHIDECAVWVERSRHWSSVATTAKTHSADDLRSFLEQETWQEVFRLLFQSLSEDRAVDLLGRFFQTYEKDLDPSELPRINPASGKVLSQVVADKFVPIPEAVRREAASILFDWERKHQLRLHLWAKADSLTEFHLLFSLCDNSQLQQWIQLTATAKSLTRLEGFERFKSLRLLVLVDRPVRDLTPLQGLKGLETLRLNGTQVADLTPLEGLSTLTTLNLSDTQVKDLTPLKDLNALTSLFVNGTQVEDLTPIKGLNALQVLHLSNTQVEDLTPIKGLNALKALNLSNTQVEDLTPIKGLYALTALHLSNTQVEDLAPIKGLNALTLLNLSNTQVEDLTPLQGLKGLETMYLVSTQVEDLTPIKGLNALTALDISDTQAEDLTPIKGLNALKALKLARTQVKDLTPLKDLNALTSLFLNGTQVEDLTPIKGLNALQVLHLSNTQVEDLTPIRGLNALQVLYLSNTQVPSKQVKDLQQCLPNCRIWL